MSTQNTRLIRFLKLEQQKQKGKSKSISAAWHAVRRCWQSVAHFNLLLPSSPWLHMSSPSSLLSKFASVGVKTSLLISDILKRKTVLMPPRPALLPVVAKFGGEDEGKGIFPLTLPPHDRGVRGRGSAPALTPIDPGHLGPCQQDQL